MLDHSKDLPIARDFSSVQCWCILVLRLVLVLEQQHTRDSLPIPFPALLTTMMLHRQVE